MSHDLNLADARGPSARTTVPTVRPVLTLPGVVRPSTPKKTDYEPQSVPSSPEDGRTGRLRTLEEGRVGEKGIVENAKDR